jgi:hypothetical protein
MGAVSPSLIVYVFAPRFTHFELRLGSAAVRSSRMARTSLPFYVFLPEPAYILIVFFLKTPKAVQIDHVIVPIFILNVQIASKSVLVLLFRIKTFSVTDSK